MSSAIARIAGDFWNFATALLVLLAIAGALHFANLAPQEHIRLFPSLIPVIPFALLLVTTIYTIAQVLERCGHSGDAPVPDIRHFPGVWRFPIAPSPDEFPGSERAHAPGNSDANRDGNDETSGAH